MPKIFIIAEAGVNHNGQLDLAYRLIDAAAAAGADAVKFQTFKSELLTTAYAPKAKYQDINETESRSQQEMLKKLELSFDDFIRLQAYCAEKGIMFLSTPFDEESMDFLDGIGMSLFKIPSGEITNLPYLRKINGLRKPVILSTGMSDLDEVKCALAVLTDCPSVSLLHCTTAYPTPFFAVNLSAMRTLAEAFRLPVGYSDHTEGMAVSVAAAALGAVIIEKHFTLDKNMEGPDHKASLNPEELAEMVRAVRNVEAALGDGVKTMTPCERGNAGAARKSLVAKVPIARGEAFTAENMTAKRPGNGVSPMRWDEFLQRKAGRDYQKDEMIDE